MLLQVDKAKMDLAWPLAENLLRPALDCNHGEATLDQVRAQLAYGSATLLLWANDGDESAVTGAAVVEFIQHPNKRIAHLSYIGGKSIVTPEVFSVVASWCRDQGASEVRALCDVAHARLFARTGFSEIYRMVKVSL